MRRLGAILWLTVGLGLSGGDLFGACGEAIPMVHNQAHLNCPDSSPVSSFAWQVTAPNATNTGSEKIACEAYDGLTCVNPTGTLGDGVVDIETYWSNPEIVGCPVVGGTPKRVVVLVIARDGSGLLFSVSGNSDDFGYSLDLAHPFPDPDAQSIDPLVCGTGNGRSQILAQTSTQLMLQFAAPFIYSDCDPGSFGAFVTPFTSQPPCNDSFNLATVALGPVYKSLQPCTARPDIRRNSWSSTGIQPDGNRQATVPITTPTDPGQCLYIGSTVVVNGVESSAITNLVKIPGILCTDSDEDGRIACGPTGDCDDHNPRVFPGAPQLCDGINNDCNDPAWPAVPASEIDADGDGLSSCQGDCNDANAAVNPSAIEVCNLLDDDCDGLVDEGQVTCGLGACRRTINLCSGGVTQACLPGAPQPESCNGIDDDCNGLVDDIDLDRDGYGACSGDCNDANAAIHPSALEICNGLDDNCNGFVDEGPNGSDSDGDGLGDACDNCQLAYNPDQKDFDADGLGNACDNCLAIPNREQADLDVDGRGDSCDNCVADYNPFQDDSDGDKVGDVCDDCPFDPNADQGDVDHDGQGNLCDLDDGLIYVTIPDLFYVEWQMETGFGSFNEYRGDMAVLRSSGIYTQDPSTTPLADRACHVRDPFVLDPDVPPPGQAFFYLITGKSGGTESSLGVTSAGVERPNDNPCP